MVNNTNNTRSRNFILIGLLLIIFFFTAFHEEYLRLISIPFWGILIVGLVLSVWLALSISTGRFMSLVFGIIILEYIKETIGIRSNMWTYHGVNGFYSFGVWAWVFGGVSAYTLSTKMVTRLVKKLKIFLPRWVNTIILILISTIIPLALGNYREGAGFLFFLFYGIILIIGIYASTKMDFPVFIGIVISAWFVGNLTEYMGSVHSGIWDFTYNPNYPPLFLVFGCWPLEILSQYSLSAFLSGETLN